MARELKAIQVTEEAFKPFGTATPMKPSHQPIDQNEALTAWMGIKDFPSDAPRTVILLTENKRPMELTKLERHVRTDEWWAMVAGDGIAVFCEGKNPMDPNDEPDLDKIVAFKMTGLAAYTTNPGVWHWPAFPTTETATQLIVVRVGTVEGDVELRDLPEKVAVVA